VKRPRCGHENRQGRKFCSERAAPLSALCPLCQVANEPDEDFCSRCGAAHSPAAALAPTTLPSLPAPAQPVPTSFAGGRYAVKKKPGEGVVPVARAPGGPPRSLNRRYPVTAMYTTVECVTNPVD